MTASSWDVSPERLAENVRVRAGDTTSPIRAFWLPVTANRDAFAEAVRNFVKDEAVCVFVLREAAFDNPNAILNDLMAMLERNRDVSLETLTRCQSERLAVVLISRSRLSVPQASSPVALPHWVPGGTRTVSVIIEDLSWTSDAPLNCPEARLDELCERLFELEDAVLSRLEDVYDHDKSSADAFYTAVKRDDDGDRKYGQLLTEFRTSRRAVSNPRAYRPSRREGTSLVSRLWVLGHAHNPEDMKPGKALARALALPDGQRVTAESLASVVRRPSSPVTDPSVAFTRDLLAALAATCQVVTAAAHSDAYERYPVSLLSSYSYDLLRALTRCQQALDQLAQLQP